MQTANGNNVIFYRNEDFLNKVNLKKVNKQKLLKKSAYFRAITKTCYRDHLSDLIEITIPASYAVFNKVVEFINTGVITINIKTVFETCHLAIYFELDCLRQLCLDHFTFNLNRRTLESQLHFLEEYSRLDNEFEERALMFRNSKIRPSYAGLYFLQDVKQDGLTVGKSLKMFSNQFQSVHLLLELTETEFSSLHHCSHMICSLVLDTPKVSLFQYNLLSGKTKISIIEHERCRVECTDNAIICSNNKNLFVIIKVKNKNNDFVFMLHAFRKQKSTGFMEMWKTHKMHFFSNKNFDNKNVIYKLWLSHCYADQLYVFYSCHGENNSADLYMLTICDKSFKILENKKLSKDIELNPDIDRATFEKMFYCEKQQKLFIKNQTSVYNGDDKALVFDMKNDRFYHIENFLSESTPFYPAEFKIGMDGKIYGIFHYYSRISEHEQLQHCTEIRTFELENDRLVDDGVEWESPHQELTRVCFREIPCFEESDQGSDHQEVPRFV